MLTERQARVLEFVVGEFVETAAPVGSQALVRKYRLGVSPATIRHEMAELEAEGYITHPHTSAGRVPTAKGYRYYVETLMRVEELSWELRQTIRHQFHQIGPGQEEWVHLAASILAQAVENAAVVTAPRTASCRIKHLELVSVNDSTALLVLVLDQARLQQQVIGLEEPRSQEELSALAARLNHLFAGLTLTEVLRQRAELTPTEREVMGAVEETMRAVDEGDYDEAYLDGVRHVLSQPEFAQSDRVLDLLELLDERNLTRLIPFRALAGGGITVIIGAENPRLRAVGDAIRQCSVVLSSYGAPGVASGAVAVLGPTRMRYPRTVSTVRYLANLMSELLAQHYD